MLRNAIAALKTVLESSSAGFEMVRYNEGQLESDAAITTPACLIDVESAENQMTNMVKDRISVRLILATEYIKDRPDNHHNSMLSIIETLQSELHKTALTNSGTYLARCMYNGFTRESIQPGLCVYSMTIDITR